MRRCLYVLLGAGLFAIVGFFFASWFSSIYEDRFAKGQDDMNSFSVLLILFVIPAFAVAGGVIGFFRHRKFADRSSGPPEGRR